jgi:hypothetical protein
MAGNFANDDILGSLEGATELAGAKLIASLGHGKASLMVARMEPEGARGRWDEE